jgi:medium-chain acyl-[acyl-carrier-protein] hydrolase
MDNSAVMDRLVTRDKWFFCKRPEPLASKRLFCFPFGGGGASVFHSWADAMGADIEVCALALPGREGRYGEPREKDIKRVIENIVQALEGYQDKPFAMFGYSLGALLAFEACRKLRRRDMKMPQQLFIAALGAPQLPPPHPPISSLQDGEFIQHVEDYYQPQGEAWNNIELREFLLPVLRDDIALYESYGYRQEPPLACPIDVFAGGEDRATPVESTRYWSEQTTDKMTHHMFNGGHFFIDNGLHEIQDLVAQSLSPGS